MMTARVFPEFRGGFFPVFWKRMLGRVCVSFAKPDRELFNQLRIWTPAGQQRVRAAGKL